jgi:hypothetical protein
MREWEEFILIAEVAWHAHQKEERRGIHGSGTREGSDKDDTLSKSWVYLSDEPSTFKFQEPQESGQVLT